MSQIEFDKIHTQTKQQLLSKMMLLSAAQTHSIQNTNQKLTACPVCGTKDLVAYTEKFGYALDKCDHCGQIFCNPMPNHEQLDCYYNGPMKEFENQFFADSFENRIPIFDFRINVILRFLNKGRLLDIGSAIGIFLEALRRRKTDLEIHCCEPSEDASKRLRERFPEVKLFTQWLHEMNPDNKYSAITLWDTLEHLVDPHAAAKMIHSLLEPSGYWFFSTPNTDSFEWEVAGKNHVQLLPPGHVNLFNTQSVEIFLKKSGFNIVEIHTPNGALDVSYIKKYITQNDNHQLQMGSFLAKNLENEIFAKEFAELISKNKKAGNVFVVAQKTKS